MFYLDWSALAAENDLPYPVISDNLVVVHDGDDEARLSDYYYYYEDVPLGDRLPALGEYLIL